ncbi:TonB-dependent receptor [Thalassotalea sp. PLHSN55]|uniref:TonB-dependent receptor n=1 Tax=Thalassotalea sp. PLHSN55 TaxID=3435888 RepID=UPI003F8291E9
MTTTLKNQKQNNRGLVYGAAGLLMAISSPTIVAQEVQTALAKQAQKEREVEVIEVTGVRSSLESALLTKRDANSIVDAISATDIDALPALDLGEALQVIPGVQIERSGEGRQSEISLRGLSGGFVKTTAFGQGFATPSRSYSDVGSSNPFSSFESSVFDGVTVIKSPTADMQAGGIAGTVDKKMQQALSKKDGLFNISMGSRYEELTKNWDPTIKLSGTKHIIEDKLAVAFKAAGSGQTFRRDTANFTDWETIGLEHPRGGTRGSNSDTIDAYKAKWNIPDEAEVRGVAQARNVTEYSEGDRISFTGNIEWRPIEDLKLGAHLLYTKRDLDSGTKQDAAFSSGMNARNARNNDMFHKIEPDMDTAPFLYDTNEDGQDVYGVTKTHITDGSWQITNRETTFLEESKGIFLYGDYITDNWAFNSVVTHSKSENQFMNVGLDFRVQGHHSPAQGGSPVIPTGIDATIDAAYGDINSASVVGTGFEDINFSIPWSVTDNLSASCLSQRDVLNDYRKLTFCLTGRVDNPVREVSSAEFNAQRYVDIGFGDVLRFESFKFGVRHSIESLDNRDQQITLGGANLANINNATVEGNPLVSSGQSSFFNGEYDGAFGVDGGWLTVDNLDLRADLQDGLADIEDGVIADPSGFYERKVGPHSQRYATNFSAEQNISAAYIMTDFAGELGDVPYSGNLGLRYVYTDNEFDGFKRDRNNPEGDILVATTIQDDYDHLLPSANFSFELHDDVVLRAAYSEGFVRPNLRILTPTTDLRSGNETATVTLPSALVKPYDAQNIDLSLEWYNRDGSAISVGVFQKVITGFFYTDNESCPEGDPVIIDALASDITYTQTGPESFTCTQNEPHLDANGELQIRDVTVNQRKNSDSDITLTGVEIAIQQKLDFLPYPWNGFGGVFNYTYIDQEAEEEVGDANNKLYKVAPQSFNIVGYYENDGYSFRLAYNWKDDSLLQATNTYLGLLPRTQQATGRLDASAAYKFNKNLKVFLRGYNLTDEKRKESWGYDDRAISRVDYTGRIFEASMSYNF